MVADCGLYDSSALPLARLARQLRDACSGRHHRRNAADDDVLLGGLASLLTEISADYTLFFRCLARPAPVVETLTDAFYATIDGPRAEVVSRWLRSYLDRVAVEALDDRERSARMNAINPLYVPRNYLVQEVIDATERGDRARLPELLEILRYPYDEQPGRAHFAGKRPAWAENKPGCSMLSCSS